MAALTDCQKNETTAERISTKCLYRYCSRCCCMIVITVVEVESFLYCERLHRVGVGVVDTLPYTYSATVYRIFSRFFRGITC